MGAENLAPTGIRFPDRSVCSESLYGPHYTGLWLNILLRILQIPLKETVKNQDLLQKQQKYRVNKTGHVQCSSMWLYSGEKATINVFTFTILVSRFNISKLL